MPLFTTSSSFLEVLMNHALCLLFLQLAVVSGFSQSVGRSRPASFPKQPDAMVQSLYRQVVARHPLGITSDKNWEVFEPYLSKGLLQRIEMDRFCQDDWVRQNQGRMVKEPFAWGELGLFSGGEALSEPSGFRIGRTEPRRDGSIYVYVELRRGAPHEKPWDWDVAVRVVMEEGYPAVDDVIYLKCEEVRTEYRLSEILVRGCDGQRWVGYGDQQRQSK